MAFSPFWYLGEMAGILGRAGSKGLLCLEEIGRVQKAGAPTPGFR